MIGGAGEDEVVFYENDKLRILRGIIISEDKDFVYLQRRDGDWSIRKDKVLTVRRARR